MILLRGELASLGRFCPRAWAGNSRSGTGERPGVRSSPGAFFLIPEELGRKGLRRLELPMILLRGELASLGRFCPRAWAGNSRSGTGERPGVLSSRVDCPNSGGIRKKGTEEARTTDDPFARRASGKKSSSLSRNFYGRLWNAPNLQYYCSR